MTKKSLFPYHKVKNIFVQSKIWGSLNINQWAGSELVSLPRSVPTIRTDPIDWHSTAVWHSAAPPFPRSSSKPRPFQDSFFNRSSRFCLRFKNKRKKNYMTYYIDQTINTNTKVTIPIKQVNLIKNLTVGFSFFFTTNVKVTWKNSSASCSLNTRVQQPSFYSPSYRIGLSFLSFICFIPFSSANHSFSFVKKPILPKKIIMTIIIIIIHTMS